MQQTVLIVFAVTALLGLISLLLPLAERFSIPYTVLLALVGIAIGVATNVPAAYLHGGARARHHRHLAQFRAQRRIPAVHLSAGAAVRGGAQPRYPPARRRGRPGAAAGGDRRRRLHPRRRLCLVATGAGRARRLSDPWRRHRHHRPGRGRRHLPRHRRAAPAVDPGPGREPVQRRGGDRDLCAGRCDFERRQAGEPMGRGFALPAAVRRRSRPRLCRRLGDGAVHAGAAFEPARRSDDDDRLCLRHLHHLRSLPRRFRGGRGRRGSTRGQQRRPAAPRARPISKASSSPGSSSRSGRAR